MRVPEALKAEIKAKNNLVDVVSEYVEVKREGNLYVACCPFPHGGTDSQPYFEKDPSFTIYPNGTFYCYGCGKGSKEGGASGSDVIAFISEIEGLGYIDACRYLAERAGIPFHLARREDAQVTDKINSSTEDNRRFFLNLWNNNYNLVHKLAQDRGIDVEWLKIHGRLGLVPADHPWQIVRGRICVGIPEMAKVANPRTVAMAYRHPDGREPKWVNDPSSPVFDKKSMLYYFPYAYKSIRKNRQAIIMEGYYDVLSAHYHGLTNTVGIMGSQFTEQQMDILRKETDTVIMWPDGDDPGTEIVRSSLPKLLDRGFKVIWVRVTGDPDEVMKGRSLDEIKRIISDNSILALLGIVTMQSERIARACVRGNATPETADIMRAECLDQLIPSLQAVKRPGELALYLERISKAFSIAPNNIMYAINKTNISPA